MYDLALLVTSIAAGVQQWAADCKASALANRIVHPPISNQPAIEAVKYVQSTDAQLHRRLEALASLHPTFFDTKLSSTSSEDQVTTSQSVKVNTTLSDRVNQVETFLKGVMSGAETDDERPLGHAIDRCELKFEDKLAISDACQSYEASAAYEARKMRGHLLKEELLYRQCASVASSLRETRVPQYSLKISTLRTLITALAITIDAEQQTLDRDRDTTYESEVLNGHAYCVALATIYSRKRELDAARAVRDGIADSLEQHVGTWSAKFALDGAEDTLMDKRGVWSRNGVWMELRPGQVVEHLQRLVDAGLEIR